MIIPVIFSLAPICDELLYTWSFYKSIDIVKHYGWPVIAQNQYFEEKEKQRAKGFYSENVAIYNDMDPYTPSDDEKYIQIVFPEKQIQEYVSHFPSQTDAYIASLRAPWPQMTEFMVDQVRQLEKQKNEKAEAFLCLCDTQFIRDAAKQLNINIIHYEWSPFRGPVYRKAAYLDLTGNICDGELATRYEVFKTISSELPIFNRREILSLFLEDAFLHYAYEEDPEPEYEVGIGLGYNVPWIFSHMSEMTSAELYTEAQKVFGDNILVRYHPGDPIHADLKRGVRDSGSLIDFFRKCRRVMCQSSGLAYEAMLYNRPAYELGKSQYKKFTNSDLKGLPDHIADDCFLSFVAFGYCIPFELLKSVRYLRWRLSRPSEKEIYLYHLSYYMNCLNIAESVLSLNNQDRFKEILKTRKIDLTLIDIEREPLWMKSDEISRLAIKNFRLNKMVDSYKQKENFLEKNISMLTAELNKQGTMIAEQASKIAEQASKIAEQASKIAERDSKIAERDGKIVEQASKIAERDSKIAECDSKIAEQASKIAEQDSLLTNQINTISSLNAELEEIKRLKLELEIVCNDMINSRSWRITKGLRLIMQFVRSRR